MTRRRRSITVFAVALLLCDVALAMGPPQALETRTSFDFGLYFVQSGYSLDTGSGKSPTTVEWAGIGWNERFSEQLQLGLHIGNTYLTQTQNPLTAGQELVGHHAGIRLTFDFTPRARSAGFLADVTITRQEVDHETDAQTIQIEWTDSRAGLWMWLYPWQSVQFVAGVRYGTLSGTQLAAGGVNSSTELEMTDSGTALGINFNDGRGGSVGYMARYGLDSGGQLYFKRQF